MLIIDKNSGLPYHYQIEKYIRELIKKEEYKKGKLIPRENDIAKKLGVARNTVRQAINTLVFEGLLERKKGIGTKIKSHNLNVEHDSWLEFVQKVGDIDIRFQNIEVNTSWVKPSTDHKYFFDLKNDNDLFELIRIRGINKQPYVYFISVFHPKVGLNNNDNFKNVSLYEKLEKEKGIIPVLSREEIKAVVADKFLSSKLNIKAGDPVLYRKRLVYDIGNKPIEYNEGWYVSEGYTYSIDVKRNIKQTKIK